MGRNTRRLFAVALVVIGAGAAGAQTTPTMVTTTTTAGTPSPSALAAAAEPAVERIVAIAQTVEPGATGATAFTVPSGRQLVLTDVVITNPSATPVCGAAISPGTAASDTGAITSTGGSTTTTTPGGSTVTTPSAAAAVESGTGTLCVPAQTSLALSLTTGLEFTGGQSVVLANQPLVTAPPATTTGTTATAAATAAAPSGPLFYHLRGFLTVSGA